MITRLLVQLPDVPLSRNDTGQIQAV